MKDIQTIQKLHKKPPVLQRKLLSLRVIFAFETGYTILIDSGSETPFSSYAQSNGETDFLCFTYCPAIWTKGRESAHSIHCNKLDARQAKKNLMIQSHERNINHLVRLKDFWDGFVQSKWLTGFFFSPRKVNLKIPINSCLRKAGIASHRKMAWDRRFHQILFSDFGSS